MRRSSISNRKSRRNFSRNTVQRSDNLPKRHMRGGYRM